MTVNARLEVILLLFAAGAAQSATAQDFGGAASWLMVDPTGAQQGAEYGRQLTTGDYDGDGVADLAVASPKWDNLPFPDGGRVFVYLGAPAGPVFNAAVGVSIPNVLSGTAIASGNFDADPEDELLIGSPGLALNGAPSGAGAVEVTAYSTSSGTVAPTGIFLVSPLPAADEGFGSALAVGDFNADGYEDVAIGIPGYDVKFFDPGLVVVSDAGAVTVSYGSSSGLQPPLGFFTQDDLLPFSAQEGEEFGRVLAVGDFNGDGKDDLAVGSPTRTVEGVADSGEIVILEGSPSGLMPTSLRYTLADFSIPFGMDASRFGAALAAGDFNRAGCNPLLLNCRDDLAIGAPGWPLEPTPFPEVGVVVIAPGSASGPTWAGSLAFQQGDLPGGHLSTAGDRFGSSLVAGHFDAQLGADLLIGVPWDETGALGTIHLVPGNAFLVSLTDAQTLAMTSGVPTPQQEYASSMVVADFDGDGQRDLAVGIPSWDPDGAGPMSAVGAVELLFGGPLFADDFETGDTSAWTSSLP
jgi:hypothetical protein